MELPAALEKLRQPQSLSILTLSEPILHPATAQRTSHRNSSQQNGHTISTPSSLAADLAHYQEHFSKLRFSYVEQVTKERFLRAITSDPPEFVSAAENAELEEQLKQDKADLKEKKQEVREIIRALEEQGRLLAQRYDQIQLRTTHLESLPWELDQLREAIATLSEQQEPEAPDPEMRLPLAPTRDLLRQRQQELTGIDAEIERLRATLPAQRAETQRLREELAPVQMRRDKAVEEAREARRRREDGGMADELEERGRWLRGVEGGMRAMLEV